MPKKERGVKEWFSMGFSAVCQEGGEIQQQKIREKKRKTFPDRGGRPKSSKKALGKAKRVLCQQPGRGKHTSSSTSGKIQKNKHIKPANEGLRHAQSKAYEGKKTVWVLPKLIG